MYIKVLFIFIILFVNLSYFSNEYSKYAAFFIKNNKSRFEFYITKYIAVIFFDSFEYLLIIMEYEGIKEIMPYGIHPFSNLILYLKLYLVGLFYFGVSSFILSLFKSSFSLIIPLIYYWGSDIIISGMDLTKTGKILLLSFMVSVNTDGVIYYGLIHLIFLIIIIYLANILSLVSKDVL